MLYINSTNAPFLSTNQPFSPIYIVALGLQLKAKELKVSDKEHYIA